MLDPITGWFVVQHTRDLAHSALPDAPVRPEPEPASARPFRHRAAGALRRLADRLEPVPRLSADAR